MWEKLTRLIISDPVLERLERELVRKALDRWAAEGNRRITNLDTAPREAKDKITSWVNAWKTTEQAQLKNTKEIFQRIAFNEVLEAITVSFDSSRVGWYALEAGSNTSPDFLAAPYKVLQYKAREHYPNLLGKKIEFKNMMRETLHALADEAIDRYYDRAVKQARKDRKGFSLGTSEQLVIVDVIPNDFYYLDRDERVSRIDMVVLGRNPTPEAETAWKKERIREWRKLAETRGRRDDRRFMGEYWGLPREFLDQLKTSSAAT